MNPSQTKENDPNGRCFRKVPIVTALYLRLDETDGPLDWHHYHGRGEVALPGAFFDRENDHDAVFMTDNITVEYAARSLWAVLGARCVFDPRIPRDTPLSPRRAAPSWLGVAWFPSHPKDEVDVLRVSFCAEGIAVERTTSLPRWKPKKITTSHETTAHLRRSSRSPETL